MNTLDIDQINKAFSPAQEIQDPKLFVGRRDEIEAGMKALSNSGGFIAVFGQRGVGKSSMAYQLKLIAEGSCILPKTLGLETFLPRKGFNFLVHYIRCDGFIKNVEDVIKRLMFGDDNNPSLFSLTKSGDKKLSEYKKILEAKGGAGILGTEVGVSGKQEETYRTYVSDNIIQQ